MLNEVKLKSIGKIVILLILVKFSYEEMTS